MKLVCAPKTYPFPDDADVLRIILYGRPDRPEDGSAGAALMEEVLRRKLVAAPRAWDLLSLALSVIAADFAGHRDRSPDGWSREFELEVAVADPAFWNTQAEVVQAALAFLSTDRWRVRFVGGGMLPEPPREQVLPDEDCVVLLSGGLDSLVGVIDLVTSGKRPYAVSQTVRGDAEKQKHFAERIGGGLRHLKLNHNARVPHPENPPSQRARSLTFLAYGVLAATALARYHEGETVTLYVCENGYISINPPLTAARLGSLSTRTTHPVFLRHVQQIVDAAGLRLRIENPYQHKTKGEMLAGCADRSLLKAEAASSTSCGRYKVYGYRHCGRCVPCQVRRAAFLAWGVADKTDYVFEDLGRDDSDYAGFDDVRSAAMAIAEVKMDGLDNWLGTALSSVPPGEVAPLRGMVERGLAEIAALHRKYRVK
ncbi:MAG TPA: Qat anti-phage system QueC-like protein QatC [Pyrinomonadaceae bacterium]|jgi:7-cyano-7-deazaguanine synthase in queuosine biosynthesis